MAADDTPETVLAHVATLRRGDDLARLVHAVAFAAADERRSTLAEGLGEVVDRMGLAHADADTDYGNVIRALERGGAEAAGSATRLLLSALLARGVALSPPAAELEAESRVVTSLLWLSAHASIDALHALDAALGERAGRLWRALGAVVSRVDAGQAPLVGRAGAVLGAAALAESASPDARAEAQALAPEIRDPIVRSLLAGREGRAPSLAGATSADARASGELTTPPRSAVALVLLGVTGILAALLAGRVVGKYALRVRRPAEVLVTEAGVTVRSRTEVLGKLVREREVHIPSAQLARAARLVRFPRLPLYAGLAALAIGSYLGLSLFVDGVRAGSPELTGIGALLVAVGVALDFALENVPNAARGRCTLVFVPRRGAAVAVADVDPAVADATLRRLQREG